MQRLHGSGGKWKTTPAEDRFRPFETDTVCLGTHGELINAHGSGVITQTARNRLRKGQLKSWRHLRVPRLQPHHRIRRQQFEQERVQWQLRLWTPVFFSDESIFHLSGLNGRIRVWRREKERTRPCTVQETVA